MYPTLHHPFLIVFIPLFSIFSLSAEEGKMALLTDEQVEEGVNECTAYWQSCAPQLTAAGQRDQQARAEIRTALTLGRTTDEWDIQRLHQLQGNDVEILIRWDNGVMPPQAVIDEYELRQLCREVGRRLFRHAFEEPLQQLHRAELDHKKQKSEYSKGKRKQASSSSSSSSSSNSNSGSSSTSIGDNNNNNSTSTATNQSTRLGLIVTESVIAHAESVNVARAQTADIAEEKKTAAGTRTTVEVVMKHNLVKRFFRYMGQGIDKIMKKFTVDQLQILLKLGGKPSRCKMADKLVLLHFEEHHSCCISISYRYFHHLTLCSLHHYLPQCES